MKVLLVCKSKKMENLGVMYLSAVVKRCGHSCMIKSVDEAYAMAKLWQPDIVGYSIMTGDQKRFKELNEKIKSLSKVMTIAGGPHPTFFPDDCEWADMIIAGEAEEVLADLLPGSDPPKFPNLDSIPWPDRTDFPDMPIRDFISSRGCPFNCTYCYNERWSKLFPKGDRVRYRWVVDVIEEILAVRPEFAYFQDSCFGVDLLWMKEFSERYQKVRIPYHCHLRPAQVEERVFLLKQSGCLSVRIALETAVDHLRKIIGRASTSNEETYRAAKFLRTAGIYLMIQNMLGLPGSTIDDDLQTLEVNIIARPSYGWCSIFAPYPGTALADYCIKHGMYSGDFSELSDSFFDKSVLNFDDHHKEQLVCLQRLFALCVEAQYLPKAGELTKENMGKLVHKIMRHVGDKRLYGGAI